MLTLAVISTIAAAAQLLFVWLIMARLRRQPKTLKTPAPAAGVTVIKPLYGLEPNLAENLRSWLGQSYPGPRQFIFSLQDEADPALPLARTLQQQFPRLDITVTVNPVRPGLTGKSSNLLHAVKLSKHDVLVFSDSDIKASPGTLAFLAGAVAQDPRRVQVAVPIPCLPRGLGGALMTLAVYLAIIVVWLASISLPGPLQKMTGVPGGTIALSRHVLTSVGGVAAFGNHITEDLKLGRLLFAHGFRAVAGPPVDLVIGNPSPRDFWHLMVRGNRGLWGLAPAIYSLWLAIGFWHYGAIAAGLLLGRSAWVGLAVAMVAARALLLLLFITAVRPATAWTAFYFPLFEAASLLTFLWVPLSSGRATVSWRGLHYRLTPQGQLQPTASPRQTPPEGSGRPPPP